MALGRFSANVATASLQRCFDVGPTFFQRFYNMPLLIAISVLQGLTGIICSKKEKMRSIWLSPDHLLLNPPRAKRSGLLTHAMRTVYRPLKSKILVVFSASPAPFFSKLVACARARFQDPPDCRGQQILLATRQKCENVGGGHLVRSGED